MRSIALRALLSVTITALGGSTVMSCSSDDTPSTAPDATADAPADLCDLNAYTGVGKPCAYVSSKLCFRQCNTGGCKCTASASGPVWACVSDFSCLPDGSPLDDASPDTSTPLDAGADAILDAPADG